MMTQNRVTTPPLIIPQHCLLHYLSRLVARSGKISALHQTVSNRGYKRTELATDA